MPFDQGLIFQDGRPLVYDSGDYPGLAGQAQGAGRLGRLPGASASRRRPRGARVGIGLACYVEGTGVGPYEGGHVRVETDGKVVVSTGLTTQGQGHQTMLRADRRRRARRAVRATSTVITGDTRRFKYAVGTFASRTAVMSGSGDALTARPRCREKALRIAAEALEVDVEDLEIVDGDVQVKGSPGPAIDLGAVAVLSNPLRYAFDEAARPRHPVRRAGRPRQAAGRPRTTSRAWRARDYYSPAALDLRQRHARRRRRDRPGHRRGRGSCATASSTTAAR